ncbi:MAG TPA: hypothetical protein VEG43_03890 [Dehalococcoidia bacterium]|nr:hypothetical protein [Dehalococcoidia bacterium]
MSLRGTAVPKQSQGLPRFARNDSKKVNEIPEKSRENIDKAGRHDI